MTKKVFTIMISLFLLAILLALVGLNSFFQENLRLLQERNKVNHTNELLVKENKLLQRQIPPVPKGAVIEGMRVSPDPESANSDSPKYILTFWVKNPTDKEIFGARGILYMQGIGAGSRLEYIPISIPAIAPGERQWFSSEPITLGRPGVTVEVIASLWGEPGIAKTAFRIPYPKVEEKSQEQQQPANPTGQPKPQTQPATDQSNL